MAVATGSFNFALMLQDLKIIDLSEYGPQLQQDIGIANTCTDRCETQYRVNQSFARSLRDTTSNNPATPTVNAKGQ
ncbi:hypothetical protein NHJ13051_006337 [Beauveria bassiana]